MKKRLALLAALAAVVSVATVLTIAPAASAAPPTATLGNLLGLVVDLNQVHLTITGQTGPGNLLGNLLCGLANALNGSGTGVSPTS